MARRATPSSSRSFERAEPKTSDSRWKHMYCGDQRLDLRRMGITLS
jgi:hypothetical protein